MKFCMDMPQAALSEHLTSGRGCAEVRIGNNEEHQNQLMHLHVFTV